jgi:hypothetical protein
LKDKKQIILVKIGAFVGLFYTYDRMDGAGIRIRTKIVHCMLKVVGGRFTFQACYLP